MHAYFSEIEKLIQVVKEKEASHISDVAQIIVQRLQKVG